jgi:hypothetical protein
MDSINSQIPKKACIGLVHWAKKHSILCKKHGVLTPPTSHATATDTDLMVHPRSPGPQLSLTRKATTQVVQTLPRLVGSTRKFSVLPSKRLHKVRNIAIITIKVTVSRFWFLKSWVGLHRGATCL